MPVQYKVNIWKVCYRFDSDETPEQNVENCYSTHDTNAILQQTDAKA